MAFIAGKGSKVIRTEERQDDAEIRLGRGKLKAKRKNVRKRESGILKINRKGAKQWKKRSSKVKKKNLGGKAGENGKVWEEEAVEKEVKEVEAEKVEAEEIKVEEA